MRLSCSVIGAVLWLVVTQVMAGQNRRPDAPAIETGFLNRTISVNGVEYRYQVYVPREYRKSVVWPVILSLHGGGQYGSDGIRQTSGALADAIRQDADRFPTVVVFPQSHTDGTPGWQGHGGEAALAELDKTLSEFNGDSSRIYLVGASAGGNGAWYLAMHHAQRFAALVVASGFVTEHKGTSSGISYPSIAPATEPDPFVAVARAVASLPIWIVHGDADRTVPVRESRQMYSALKSLTANVQYTEIPGADHLGAIDAAFKNSHLIAWMLEQRRH
jgi:predicted peptidase